MYIDLNNLKEKKEKTEEEENQEGTSLTVLGKEIYCDMFFGFFFHIFESGEIARKMNKTGYFTGDLRQKNPKKKGSSPLSSSCFTYAGDIN